MFKLIKIINSGTSVPEIVKINGGINNRYKTGAIYFASEGGLCPTPCDDTDFMFIPLKDCTTTEKNNLVTGYIVSEEMLFETDAPPIGEEPLIAGSSYSYLLDSNNVVVGMQELHGNDIKLINTDSIDTTGKITVVLKW